MKIATPVLLIACLVGLTGCLTTSDKVDPKSLWSFSPYFNASKIERVAIIVEDASQSSRRWQSDNSYTQIADNEFTKILLTKGYRISSRADVDKVMEELDFQRSGLTDSQTAARLGKMLNVDAILIVSVNSRLTDQPPGYEYYAARGMKGCACDISCKMLSVQEAEILGVGSYRDSTNVYGEQNIISGTRRVSRTLAEGIPSKFSTNNPTSSASLQ